MRADTEPNMFEYGKTVTQAALLSAVESCLCHAGPPGQPGQQLAPGIHDKTMTVGLAPTRMNARLRCCEYETLVLYSPRPQQQ